MNKLNRIGPRMDPCGTPDSKTMKELKDIVYFDTLLPIF